MNGIWKKSVCELPEDDSVVLAHFEDGGMCLYAICFYGGADEWFEIHGDRSVEVDCPPLHWMELPDEPES